MSSNFIKPAIVIAAYNRPSSLARLLHSLTYADYRGYDDIPLIISIDNSPITEVSEIADNYTWKYGSKKVIKHETNIGLKANILFCGDLTKEYNSVIVLEDDLFVSPAFYDYTCQSINFYNDSDEIAGISLYSYDFNEYAKMRFIPLHDGFDNYFLQSATSWGQAWTWKQWNDFKTWYSDNNSISQDDPLPENVINWKDNSWKKNYIKYMVLNKKYFVVPRISLTTNFSEEGTNAKRQVHSYQVPMLMQKKKFNFSKLEESNSIYDCYYEISSDIIKNFNSFLQLFDFECDFYGSKKLSKVQSKYLLTIRDSYCPETSYSLNLIPHELNAINQLNGNFFNLSKVDECQPLKKSKKLSQYMYMTFEPGARMYGNLLVYDILKRVKI